MFDFAWSELGVIAVVALIFIGPKDMPVAVKAVSRAIKKARGMAAEFQTHVDEMVRDADLTEVRDQIGALRGYNVTRALEKLVDDDGSIRRTLSENPLAGVAAPSAAPAPVADGDLALAERPASEVQPALSEPEPITPEPEAFTPEPVYRSDTPAFIPPGAAPPPESRAAAPEAPAFIPPEVARAAGPPHAA